MAAAGETAKYTWMWDAKREVWKPLDPPPPPLEKDGTLAQPTGRKGKDQGVLPGYEALCLDSRTAVSAVLEAVTETSCELRIPPTDAGSPPFAMQAPLTLNLLHPDTGHSLNVRARLAGAKRHPDGSWTYELRWNSRPSFAQAA
ncbi:MAG TPA: hypothetical protein VL588_01210, partial [Bdellovibrionota bacterium]|nr:hypothetical protein [Bdellovibrionota bacterium]